MSLFSILVDISANTAKMESGMRRAGDLLEGFGEKVQKAVEMSAGILGIGLGFEGLAHMIETATDRGEQLTRLSERMHVTVEDLSQLQFAASMTGVSFQTLTGAMDLMQKNVGMAAENTGRARTALVNLHLDAKNLLSLQFDKQLEAIANAIQKIPNPARQAQLAMQLMGTTELLPFLKDGAAGIQRLREEADRLGITLSTEGAAKLKEAADEMKRMKAETTALSTELAIALVPALTSAAHYLTTAIQGIGDLGRAMHLLEPKTEIDGLNEQLLQLMHRRDDLLVTQQNLQNPTWLEKLANTKGLNLGNLLPQNLNKTQSDIKEVEKQIDAMVAKVREAEDKSKKKDAPPEIVDMAAYYAKLNEMSETDVQKTVEAFNKKKDAAAELMHAGQINAAEYAKRVSAALDVALQPIEIHAQKLEDYWTKLEKETRTDVEKTVAAYEEKEAALKLMLEHGVMDAKEYGARIGDALDAALQPVEIHGKIIVKDAKNNFTEMEKSAQQTAQNMQASFANFLTKPSLDGFRSMLAGFMDMLERMVAEALAKKVFTALFGAGTGDGTSGLGNYLSLAMGALGFAGKAGGGPVDAGKSYLVGEHGPELFSPGGSGTITPNGSGGGGALLHFAPVYNINAPNGDAQLRAALPTLLQQTAAKSKRDMLDAFQRSGFGAPRTA